MMGRAVLIVLFIPVLAFAGSIENSQYLELSTKDIHSLQIICGPGSLDVFGVERNDRIKVTATVKISGITQKMLQEFLDKHVLLSLKKRNHKAILQSEFKNGNLIRADAKINLTVEVPKSINVKIDDGSGSIFVTGIATNLKIVDGSGSIEIRMTGGPISISDGSGKIELTDITGNLEVKDGSGMINIGRVKGDVYIVDGSGSMTIKDIDGNLTVTDGSGSIEISDVTQNVYIEEAGSGTLDIDGVKGKVTMRE
ncbi:MAG: hypothetical protein PVG96_17710 [Desulfobacterales bacterium]|jgi:DUF4097 and DUF4098 domain-containing protein YvlB